MDRISIAKIRYPTQKREMKNVNFGHLVSWKWLSKKITVLSLQEMLMMDCHIQVLSVCTDSRTFQHGFHDSHMGVLCNILRHFRVVACGCPNQAGNIFPVRMEDKMQKAVS